MTSILDAQGVEIPGRLAPADLRVEQPSLVALIGPNGSGKTSLLRALGRIEQAGGRVTVDGELLASAPPARRMRLLGFLPASRDIVWPIPARDVIALGLPVPDGERVEELLGALELSAMADRPVDRLSTGERTRVLLARAIAAKPRLLLLDEPLSNLDPYWVLRTLELLRALVRQERCGAIVALHDLTYLDEFDRVLLVVRGRIAADDEPRRLLSGSSFSEAFGIVPADGRWRIRPPGDRRSSP